MNNNRNIGVKDKKLSFLRQFENNFYSGISEVEEALYLDVILNTNGDYKLDINKINNQIDSNNEKINTKDKNVFEQNTKPHDKEFEFENYDKFDIHNIQNCKG